MPSDSNTGSVPPTTSSRDLTGRADFMFVPRPARSEQSRILECLESLPGAAKAESRRCIANLLGYRATRTRARLPRGPSAAVLVPLFVGRSGDVYVLLSRRSDALKTFAGDTALPGGRLDAQDGTVEDAARREAFEEIGLPSDKERVPLLCVMEPHLAKGEILVTPVVVLVLDHSLQPNLNSSEVTSIFAQPLVSFLSSTPYLSGTRMQADPNNPYYTFTDVPWSGGGVIRLHRFLTGRESEGVKPVFGLTSSVLIKTATIGYDRSPDFEVRPPNAPTPVQQIARALITPTNPLRVGCEREGIDADEAASWLLIHPPVEFSDEKFAAATKHTKEHIDKSSGGDGEFDPKAVFASISEEGRESLRRAIQPKKCESGVDDSEGSGQGRIGARGNLEEETKHHVDHYGDDQNPNMRTAKKRYTKL